MYTRTKALEDAIRINFDPKLYAKFKRAAGLTERDRPVSSVALALAATGDLRPNELKVFDYIYGVLHAPTYRETYREFLRIGYPRIPLPQNPDIFRHVSGLGENLRRLHLMEDGAVGAAPFRFEGTGIRLSTKSASKPTPYGSMAIITSLRCLLAPGNCRSGATSRLRNG